MASVQRGQDSDLGALNRSYTSRALLPFEVELCNSLDITVDDYWYFCRLAEAKAKERAPGYALIPDVRNDPVSIIVSLVIGAALSAVGALLAPKPKEPPEQKKPSQQRTADITGQTRFASLYSFDSLQDLATLGSVVPLVFANRNNDKNIGGIRAKALLLWSQMLSRPTQQELKTTTTLGLGPMPTEPDLEGYAVGDQLLKNYSTERFALYYRPNGGRLVEESDRYSQSLLPSQGYSDVLLVRDELNPSKHSPMFSGARTPSSQTLFGCYAPISNGGQYWLNYELVMVVDADPVARVKEEKILRPYCVRQAVERKNGVVVPVGNYPIAVGDTITFQISSAYEDENAYPPHGLTDLNNAVVDRHTFADDNISIGDTFIFNGTILECIGTSTDKPYEKGDSKSYILKCVEAGSGYFQPADTNPLEIGNQPYGQHLMRVAIGAVTNNRKCHQTEIGIKSTVYKRLNGFPNVNSQPENSVLEKMAVDKVSFSLGTISRYLTRFSFFKLQARPVGTPVQNGWIDISAGQVFAIKGNSPQAQYNVLRVVHPFAEFEFRLLPVPGSVALGLYLNNPVHLLTGSGNAIISAGNGYFVAYSGEEVVLTSELASNPEFLIGGRKPVGGTVSALAPTGVGEVPVLPGGELVGTAANWDATSRTLLYGVWIRQDNPSVVRAAWDSVDVTAQIDPQGEYRQGAPYGVNIPPKVQWTNNGAERLLLTGTASYYEVDAAGNFIGAVWNNADVSGQTEQGPDPNPAAIYRRGTQYTTAQGSTSIINDPTTPPQYNPYGPYFGVWAVRGQPSSTWRGFWNGTEVPLNVLTYVVPGQVGRFIVGNKRDYFPNINCDVYEIIRQVQTTTGGTRYFYGIQPGSYQQVEPGWTTYYIEKYEFKPEDLPYVYPPAVYPVSGGSGSGLTVNASSFVQGQWSWLVASGGFNYVQGEQVSIAFPDGTNAIATISVASKVEEGAVVAINNLNPFDAVADHWKYELEEPSHIGNAEHEIVYINEQVRQDKAPQYEDLVQVGLRLLAGKEWSNFGQLTAYVQKGIEVERLINDSGAPVTGLNASTNNLPEIAYNLLTSPRLGAGQKVSKDSVDREAMTEAARFCRANGFTWDGVLGERVNLREWIFEQAAYCLLDFTIIGGKFALVPSVPYDANGLIAPAQAPVISALFTDGNIRNMRVSWLSAEERRLFQAVVSYREEVLNGFSTQKTIRIRLTDEQGGAETDPEESFDLTAFCTHETQAQTFAKHALLLRKWVDHSVSFETVPGAVASLKPGSYFKLISQATHTSRFNNGCIDDQGNITSSLDLGDGTHPILYWEPGTTEVRSGQLLVAGKKTGDPSLFGVVFTVTSTSSEKRVYKVETLAMNEEGFVEVTGTHQPIADNGGLATIQLDATHFVVES